MQNLLSARPVSSTLLQGVVQSSTVLSVRYREDQTPARPPIACQTNSPAAVGPYPNRDRRH